MSGWGVGASRQREQVVQTPVVYWGAGGGSEDPAQGSGMAVMRPGRQTGDRPGRALSITPGVAGFLLWAAFNERRHSQTGPGLLRRAWAGDGQETGRPTMKLWA